MNLKRLSTLILFAVLSACPLKAMEVDDQKSAPPSDHDHYTVSNPLVLLTGASKYDNEKECLPTVKKEMQTLYQLFHDKCDYDVRSTFFDDSGAIRPKHDKTDKRMDGEWLYCEKLESWLDDQYDYLRANIKTKEYDALFFIFSGHGACDQYERELILASNNIGYPWTRIENMFSFPTHSDLKKWAAKSPKFFFKLTCRGPKDSEIIEIKGTKLRRQVNLASKTYTFYATSKGAPTNSKNGVDLADYISAFFSSAIENKHHLSWIDNRLKEKMANSKYALDAPACYSGIVADKVFFSTKRKPLDEQIEKQWWSALEKGSIAELKEIFKNYQVDIHATDQDGDTALHLACYFSNSPDTVVWLLDSCKIGIEAKGCEQQTPFLSAASKGQLDTLKLLKQKDAHIHAKSQYGDTALHLACLYSNSPDTVEWLLDTCHIGIEVQGYNQKTPFLSAAENGQLDTLKLLKQKGAHIKARDQYGNTALHLACRYSNSPETVEWLLDRCKISIEVQGQYQITPFLSAANNGQLDTLKLLKQKGANIHAKTQGGNTALHLACLASNSPETVEWLLDTCKIGIEVQGQYQRTPFLFAAEKGQLPILKLLKQKGAHIHATDKDGSTALHLACLFSNSPDTVKLLLDYGASKNAKDKYDKTPLDIAKEEGNQEIIKLLE